MSGPHGETPGQVPPGAEGLPSHERRLAGKKAILIGGSRDVGKGIAREMAAEGVELAISYHNQHDRAAALKDEIIAAGGAVNFFAQDLSNSQGRKAFVDQAVGHLGGRIDYLIISTSGQGADLNEELSEEILARTVDHIKEGGIVLRVNSIPGKYSRQLDGLGKMGEYYESVAKHKGQDSRNLKKKIPELAARGITYAEVIPPFVKEKTFKNNKPVERLTTNTMKFLLSARGEAHRAEVPTVTPEEASYAISDALGAPRLKYIDEIGAEVVRLLLKPDLKQGEASLMGDVEDAEAVLEIWYGTSDAVGIQTLQRFDRDGTSRGIGRSIVSKEQVEIPRKLAMIDSLEVNEDGKTVGKMLATPEKARGHLNTENGFPLLFAGHKQIRAAKECIELMEREFGNSEFSRIKRFDLAQFTRGVLADGTHSLTVLPEVVMRTETEATYNVSITNEKGEQTARIDGLTLSYQNAYNPEALPEDFMVEAAAQTAGVALLPPTGLNKDTLPLIGQLGPVEFSGDLLKPGDGVAYYVEGEGSEKGIDGAIRIVSDNKEIGQIQGLKAVAVPRRVGFRMIGFKP